MNTPVETAFWRILKSDIFRTDGDAIDLPAALIELAQAVEDEEETDWSLGEFVEADLASLLAAAYWVLSEWHGGQSSGEYAALCAIGRIYKPGMTSGPEPDSAEADAYELLAAWFAAKYGAAV